MSASVHILFMHTSSIHKQSLALFLQIIYGKDVFSTHCMLVNLANNMFDVSTAFVSDFNPD